MPDWINSVDLQGTAATLTALFTGVGGTVAWFRSRKTEDVAEETTAITNLLLVFRELKEDHTRIREELRQERERCDGVERRLHELEWWASQHGWPGWDNVKS